MLDDSTQNNTQTLGQDNQTLDNNNPQLSQPLTDPSHTDFPTISPSQGPATNDSTATPSYIESPHPTYDPSSNPQIDASAPIVSQPNQDLISIKKSALQQLSPLVGQLDQNPEDKFKTMLMMIQASDDQSMISSAYEIAQQIPDEKLKAQALLDIVNEINYFTHPDNNQE